MFEISFKRKNTIGRNLSCFPAWNHLYLHTCTTWPGDAHALLFDAASLVALMVAGFITSARLLGQLEKLLHRYGLLCVLFNTRLTKFDFVLAFGFNVLVLDEITKNFHYIGKYMWSNYSPI